MLILNEVSQSFNSDYINSEKKGEIKMFEMNVPYDKGQMKIKLEDKNLAGVLEGRQSDYKTTLSENEIVEQSLNNPIGSKSLEELAKGKGPY